MDLKTRRLHLRELHQNDLTSLEELFGNPLFNQYEPPLDPDKVQDWLNEKIVKSQQHPRTSYEFAITIPPDPALSGVISLKGLNSDIREWEIGWGVHPNFWGKGYATEAAKELLRMAFYELGAHRVTAFCHVENLSSVRVMQKIGLAYEGRLRQVRWLDNCWHDEFVYAILELDWASGHESNRCSGGTP